MKEITKDTTIAEIMENSKAESILMKHNVPCLSCPMAEHETKELKLGEVCKAYGIDLEKLLKELNEIQ